MGSLDAESYTSYGVEFLSRGWGWRDGGHWPRGIYKVEMFIDNELIATDHFEIY